MKSQILLVDKPANMSSFGVVARVRRVLTEKENQARQKEAEQKGQPFQKVKRVKVGHTGTLDPFATGLLILLTGENTKKAGEFLKLGKEYIATLRLGATSNTGDPEGEITEQNVSKIPNKTAVENCVQNFVGENSQRVPEYSAVKINGQRAYKLARAGKEIEMPVRKVQIYELEVLDYNWPELKLRCKVSSGTYIRALAEDIGKSLGVGAYLTALRRTQIGDYRIEQAVSLDDYMGGDWA